MSMQTFTIRRQDTISGWKSCPALAMLLGTYGTTDGLFFLEGPDGQSHSSLNNVLESIKKTARAKLDSIMTILDEYSRGIGWLCGKDPRIEYADVIYSWPDYTVKSVLESYDRFKADTEVAVAGKIIDYLSTGLSQLLGRCLKNSELLNLISVLHGFSDFGRRDRTIMRFNESFCPVLEALYHQKYRYVSKMTGTSDRGTGKGTCWPWVEYYCSSVNQHVADRILSMELGSAYIILKGSNWPVAAFTPAEMQEIHSNDDLLWKLSKELNIPVQDIELE